MAFRIKRQNDGLVVFWNWHNWFGQRDVLTWDYHGSFLVLRDLGKGFQRFKWLKECFTQFYQGYSNGSKFLDHYVFDGSNITALKEGSQDDYIGLQF